MPAALRLAENIGKDTLFLTVNLWPPRARPPQQLRGEGRIGVDAELHPARCK